ncbi:unnamed protein product [Clavelina lepadiformis]|uniref:Uncharacterized protein n=1 Tax=Clavelina lepadiformis TaxID=159417 RepID=A0ABP0G8Y6_CLALP
MNLKKLTHVNKKGLLYALGGYDDDNNATNTAECYDPRNGKWEYISSMKTCRDGLTAVVLNNEIYAIGESCCKCKYLSKCLKIFMTFRVL